MLGPALGLADLKKAPIILEVVGASICCLPSSAWSMADRSQPLVDELEVWLRAQRGWLSAKSETAKAIDYLLTRWPSFTRFVDDGRICLSNNAAERALRGAAVGRRNWTFAGSDVGGQRAAALYMLIETCRLNEVDPCAWLADVLARLPGHPAKRIHELLLWNRTPQQI